MADTSVKLIHSSMAGAPTLANVAGNLVSVLNYALVDGGSAAAVDSIVIAAGVATVTRVAGHPFDVDSVALIAGATTTSGTVNGEQRVLAVTATSYTFDATGIPNQAATGAPTHKVAPLGWGRPFTGSSTLQVYRSNDVAGTRLYCRVDDTGTTDARVVGYETMTADSAGTAPFPTSAQVSGGFWWPKCVSGLTNRPWMVVGDGRMFYLWVQYRNEGNGQQIITGFGDFASRKSPDPFGALISGATGALVSTTGSLAACWSYSQVAPTSSVYAARGVSGLGSSITLSRIAQHPRGAQSLYSGDSGSGHLGFPNPADNSVFLAPIALAEAGAVSCHRGEAPGVYFLPHTVGVGVFSPRDPITGVVGYGGRRFTAFPTPTGVTFFDTTGPWR